MDCVSVLQHDSYFSSIGKINYIVIWNIIMEVKWKVHLLAGYSQGLWHNDGITTWFSICILLCTNNNCCIQSEKEKYRHLYVFGARQEVLKSVCLCLTKVLLTRHQRYKITYILVICNKYLSLKIKASCSYPKMLKVKKEQINLVI